MREHQLTLPIEDQVNHPKHYNAGKFEVIAVIEDWKLPYHLGSAVKYVARAGKKDPNKEIEDLEKAVWYLKRQIELLQAKRENRPAVSPNGMNPKSTDSFSVTDVSDLKAQGGQSDIAATVKMAISGYWGEVELEIIEGQPFPATVFIPEVHITGTLSNQKQVWVEV